MDLRRTIACLLNNVAIFFHSIIMNCFMGFERSLKLSRRILEWPLNKYSSPASICLDSLLVRIRVYDPPLERSGMDSEM